MLSTFNPATIRLLPRLVENTTTPHGATSYSLRTAMVRHNVESTYVVPGDWPDDDGNRWFLDDSAPSVGSDAEYLIDGPQTFRSMGEAIEGAATKDHFVLLLAWSLDTNFAFREKQTFLQLIEQRAQLGAVVRVLLFNNKEHGDNESAKKSLNALRDDKGLDVTCHLDDRVAALVAARTDPIDLKKVPMSPGAPEVSADLFVPRKYKKYFERGNPTGYGSHHHKILLVHGRDGLVGFCGGIDLDANRLTYLHDAHVRVTGGAAQSLLAIAQERWRCAQDGGLPVGAISLPAPTTVSPMRSNYSARVVQTIGNPDLKPSIPNTLWPAVQKAIQNALRFIYIEDQYFWSLDLVDALVDASKRVKHITVLVPAGLVGEFTKLRQAAIARLVQRGGPDIQHRVGIYQMNYGAHEWAHSKLIVVDDEYAIVGSANANNRGFFLDSEAAVGIADRAWHRVNGKRFGLWYEIEATFARRMRIELWREHLGMMPEELFDGVGARTHWDNLPASASVSVYQNINLIHYVRQRDKYFADLSRWADEGRAAAAAKKPFTTPRPKWEDYYPSSDSVHRSPWWLPPADGWAPEDSFEDLLIDPKW